MKSLAAKNLKKKTNRVFDFDQNQQAISKIETDPTNTVITILTTASGINKSFNGGK